jgi:hypothetical protein
MNVKALVRQSVSIVLILMFIALTLLAIWTLFGPSMGGEHNDIIINAI